MQRFYIIEIGLPILYVLNSLHMNICSIVQNISCYTLS